MLLSCFEILMNDELDQRCYCVLLCSQRPLLSVFSVMRKTKCNLTTMEVSTVDSIECRQDVLSRKKKKSRKKTKKNSQTTSIFKIKGLKVRDCLFQNCPELLSVLYFLIYFYYHLDTVSCIKYL